MAIDTMITPIPEEIQKEYRSSTRLDPEGQKIRRALHYLLDSHQEDGRDADIADELEKFKQDIAQQFGSEIDRCYQAVELTGGSVAKSIEHCSVNHDAENGLHQAVQAKTNQLMRDYGSSSASLN